MDRELLTIDAYLGDQLELLTFGAGSPHVFITAGLHGGEATGIYAAQRLVAELKDIESELHGCVTVSPVTNVTAFRRLQRTSPYDELDLNRIFPGDETGTPSERTAAVLWKRAAEADYLVDLHCCGIYGTSYTLALHRQFDHARDFAARLDIPVVIQSGGTEGQLFVSFTQLGKPAAVIELTGGGPAGEINVEAGDRAARAVMGALRQLDVVPGDATQPSPRFCGPLQRLRPSSGGLYLPQILAGESFTEGDILATVDDEPITATFDGIAISVRPASFVFDGMQVMSVARFEEV